MSDSYINEIKQVYPHLVIEKWERNKIGQNNDVFIINDSLVFRFPKYEKGIVQLQDETTILDSIKINGVEVPRLLYQSFQQLEVGKVFTGYPLISGESLKKQDVELMQEDDVHQLATQLVSFLKELHATPIKELEPKLHLEKKNGYEEMLNLYKNIQQKLYPHMRQDAKEQVTSMFEDFLGDDKNREMELTLVHGDFGASNILWESTTLSGVIDFGGAGIGDPAYDLAGILSSYGEDFFKRCISMYPNGEEIKERVTFYQRTFALQEALHGVENNDKQAFENGIRDYQ